MEEQDKALEAVIELGKDVASDLVRPTSKSIGNNLGLLVDGVMGWLGYWGETQKIKREVCLQDYKKRIADKITQIPEESLVEPPLRIIGPAIEASKYFIDEIECREMFATLISSACDAQRIGTVHPSFPEIIKQLTPLDAKLLRLFSKKKTFPVAMLKGRKSDGIISPFRHIMFDFEEYTDTFSSKDELELTKSIDNLSRCGLVKMNREVLELNYNYDCFKNHWYYQGIKNSEAHFSQMDISNFRIELTELGISFVNCCVSNE